MLILGSLLFIVVLVFNLLLFVVLPAYMASQAKKKALIEGETVDIIDELKIIEKTNIYEATMEWLAFGQVYETPECFLLASKVNKGSYGVIPIRAFTTPQYITFRSVVQEKMQPILRIL
jgi:hypothetical protein